MEEENGSSSTGAQGRLLWIFSSFTVIDSIVQRTRLRSMPQGAGPFARGIVVRRGPFRYSVRDAQLSRIGQCSKDFQGGSSPSIPPKKTPRKPAWRIISCCSTDWMRVEAHNEDCALRKQPPAFRPSVSPVCPFSFAPFYLS